MRNPVALICLLSLVSVPCSQVSGQRAPAVGPAASADDPTATDRHGGLRFSFDGAAWRDVIKWVADEADLALHVGNLPTGSFTYSDSHTFTHQEAIDRINLFLLPQGFTLVRSGKLLTVIDLGDPRSMRQLDAIAETVTAQQLGQRNSHDVVKCIFPLGEVKAEEAVQELAALDLMTTPTVLARTNQLIITDTAAKLSNVKAVLEAFQSTEMENGTIVQSFALQHVDAEDILVVARPHLGLATGEMIGIDVSLSADLQGKNIFVTGVEDKVKLLEGLVTAIDRPEQSSASGAGQSELRSHLVEGGNVELVYNVLQTLLAGKSVRLSMDETAGAVVALATPDVQAEIEQTVAQLQATEADFEVIPLKTVDPYFAISLLEEMLDLPDPLDDREDIDREPPKIDADPGNMRLFVRGKASQIEQIKKIISGLDNSQLGDGDKIRMLPLRGKEAEQVLDTAVKFWREPNPVVLYRSPGKIESEQVERVVNQDPAKTPAKRNRISASDSRRERLLTTHANDEAALIRCQLTPRGLYLQSDDVKALEQFEEHLRLIAGPMDTMPSPPIAFYLKYTKPDAAIRMLAELLDGGESASEFEAGSLVNAYVSSSDSLLGSFVSSRDGTTTLTAGTITVVADSRLNRLIAQGTASDIERIEGYLKIIDKDNSITSIETYGTSRVIELVNTKASEVAVVIRDAFAGRVAAAVGTGQSNVPGGQSQGQREIAAVKAEESQKGGQDQGKKQTAKKPTAQPTRDLEPKMTIAVHEPSNSLVVTAPEQMFLEVEKLVKSIDARGEQMVKVISPANGLLYESMLQQVLLGEPSSNNRVPRSPPRAAPDSKSDR